MAVATRRKKKKTKKSEETKNILDQADLNTLENLSRDEEIARKDMQIEEQALRNMNLELKLFEYRMISQRELLKTKAERYENIKKKFVEYKKEIFPKYGVSLDKGLGYNPDTGEIVLD